jgi:hypothetical protein
MDTTKQKYVRLKELDSFIFFPEIIEHSTFKHLNPISAGFCYLNDDDIVKCFGGSISLGIDSNSEDTILATKQVYGFDAMLKLL